MRDASLGRTLPLLCPRCAQLEQRGLKAVAQAETTLRADDALPAILGTLAQRDPQIATDDRPSGMIREKFGVRDEEIEQLYGELQRSDTPVVIAVAPTGSGKSTFLPYRLLDPVGLPRDTFTRGRQIVITQPRRDATIGITGYVAGTLHGADHGLGQEIGYRVRGQHACDWDNRMVYVTDGTLINWLVQGQLDRISLIVIDEAHERSLNIDVIIGLVTRMLPQAPHLKMLIVSATIDHEKFRRYFDAALPGSLRCGVVRCSGSKPVGLDVHYRADDMDPLPYGPGPLRDFGKEIALELAEAMVTLIMKMHKRGRSQGPEVVYGDVLGFLHGAAPIDSAVEHIKARLAALDSKLAKKTDVYPLYAAVDAKVRAKAIGDKADASRLRVVIASNAAETSLTIDSLVHVVESGFIKQTKWDPVAGEAPLLPIAHSQAGCRQRWGRVGRTMQGYAWCLYTKEQFEDVFRADTQPEIQRARLDGVILSAKRGGAGAVTAKQFPWLDAPDESEITRTIARLIQQGSLDEHEDLTEAGVEAARTGGEEAEFARLIADADRFGFGIEVATLLALVAGGMRDLLPDDRDASAEERQVVHAAQARLRSACEDDLELALRVFDGWWTAGESPRLSRRATWQPPKLSAAMQDMVGDRSDALAKRLKRARTPYEIRRALRGANVGAMAEQNYVRDAVPLMAAVARAEWAQRNGVDAGVLREAAKVRADTIRKLGAKKKELEDRPIDFPGLERLRVLIARAFVGSAHKRIEQTDSTETRYEALYPQGGQAAVLLAGRESACSQSKPSAVVPLGGTRGLQARASDGPNEPRRLMASFLVRMDPTWVRSVVHRDDLELAEYFRQELPRVTAGSEEEKRQALHREVRRDLPIGSQVRCRVLGESGGAWDVEVIEALGWPDTKPPKIRSSESRRERHRDRVEKHFDFTSHGKGRRKKSKRKGEAEFDGARQALPEQDPSDQDIWDDTAEAETTSEASSEAGSAPASSDTAAQAPRGEGVSGRAAKGEVEGLCVPGRLRVFAQGGRAPRKGDELVAEIVEHADLRALPSVVAVAPTRAERFAAFAESAKVGDEIDVEVIGVEGRESALPGLRVRAVQSGLVVIVPTEDLGLGRATDLLRAFPLACRMPLKLAALDPSGMHVRLSGRERTLKFVDRFLASTDQRPREARVYAVDGNDRRYYVDLLLAESQPQKGLLVPVKIELDRSLFETPDGAKAPYKVGERVHVRVRTRDTARSRSVVRLDRLSGKERSALKAAGVQSEGGQLSCEGPQTAANRARVLGAAKSPDLRRAYLELLAWSNTLFGDRIITDLEQRFKKGNSVAGKAIWAGAKGVEVALGQGVMGLVPLSEITWWSDSPMANLFASKGQDIKAVVTGVDANAGRVVLSMKRTTKNPWEGGIRKLYPSGKRVEGTVRNVLDFGAFVQLEPGLDGLIPCRGMRDYHGDYVEYASEVVSTGDRVRVTINEIELGRRRIGLELVTVLGRDKSVVPTGGKKRGDPHRTDSSAHFGYGDELKPTQPTSSPWPWGPGERAIKKEQPAPPPPPEPAPAATVPIDQRRAPRTWMLGW